MDANLKIDPEVMDLVVKSLPEDPATDTPVQAGIRTLIQIVATVAILGPTIRQQLQGCVQMFASLGVELPQVGQPE